MKDSLFQFRPCGATEPHDRHEHLVGVRRFDCRGVPGCTGSSECRAEEHIHGCFADTGNCDEPREHCAACQGDLEAHGLHVCGRSFGG